LSVVVPERRFVSHAGYISRPLRLIATAN
jgi:hypothetical protein